MATYYRLKIERDDNPSDPRSESNVGTMLCWHRRYNIGDTNEWRSKSPGAAMLSLISEFNPAFDCDDSDTALIQAEFEKHFVVLPIYMYDHGGQTISTAPFSCRWDSGQLGFIYLSHKKAHEEYGHPEFKDKGPWNEAKQAKAVECLTNEVKTLDIFMQGDIFGYTLEKLVYEFEQPEEEVLAADDSLDWKEESSCWGFYGDEIPGNGMLDNIGKQFLEAAEKAQDDLDEWVLIKVDGDKVEVVA